MPSDHNVVWLNFSLEKGLGVPQNGPHDSKPEGIRLTTNAISVLKPAAHATM